jgi:hypothetical protein
MGFDKRMIGLSISGIGIILASLALYFFGVSTGKEDKGTESIGSKIASIFACLFLLGGGSLAFIAFKDRGGGGGGGGGGY